MAFSRVPPPHPPKKQNTAESNDTSPHTQYEASLREIEKLFERYGPVERVDMKMGEQGRRQSLQPP